MTQPDNPVVRWLSSRMADVLWKIMALVALVVSLAIGVRQFQMTACQARFNEASNASTRARAEAAEVDRRAVDDLMRSVAAHPREALEAIGRYNSARALGNEQRAANPVPPPPSDTCG